MTAAGYRDHAARLTAFRRAGVYPVITAAFCAGGDPVAVAEAVLRGGAGVIQIREKTMPDGDFLQLLRQIRPMTRAHGALLIVDDRVDAALAADADGVHLGQEDLPLAAARQLAPELLIGISTHNEAELLQAQSGGCSYLNIGPIYPTGTKSLPIPALGTDTLRRLIPQVQVPFSVMGGIKWEHLPELCRYGVRHIAAVTAFTRAADPAAEVARWNAVIRHAVN